MTQKGQVTVPVQIRKKLGLKPGQKVVFNQEKGAARLKPAIDFFSLKGFIKTKKKFTVKTLHEEEKAAREYVVKQYLKKEKRIRKQSAK